MERRIGCILTDDATMMVLLVAILPSPLPDIIAAVVFRTIKQVMADRMTQK